MIEYKLEDANLPYVIPTTKGIDPNQLNPSIEVVPRVMYEARTAPTNVPIESTAAAAVLAGLVFAGVYVASNIDKWRGK
ncbi:hypothetical protein HOC01_01365 [archaeon]|mgnify:CR=1 FL=1|jgi:hypothetical protein|nr:hypothetical protein [archaeon]MBT6698031.1 hypothetical protein [archaeon]